ncbi:hypothetical protein [Pyxidicoccus xibeiensis]|uniref:hypothetical protein n=1 Tax=Pyxidicoccus xibeiensis TaxID=2906759 RepID=UPI0020A773CB|nr:hypothetical protein [Pyxidicoccus xibeiensis]MCP3139956.1 hypothetical protein [Pyxidicoccus xibeiensis]
MSRRPLLRLVPLWVLAGLSLGHGGGGGGSGGGGGCGGSDDGRGHEEEPVHTRPSGARCPPSAGPTADSFGRDFLERYCLSCHSASVTGEARAGAPEGVDFDTPEQVREWATAIDSHSAAGPNGPNTAMPPATSPTPSMDERLLLGQWLSCGAP